MRCLRFSLSGKSFQKCCPGHRGQGRLMPGRHSFPRWAARRSIKPGAPKGWALMNWCFQTVALEKTLESPFDGKEIQPVNPKGNKPWIFIGRTDVSIPGLGGSPWRRERLLTPVFWPGEFHRLYSAWGHKESDVTEQLAVSISLSSYLNILKERDVIYHVFWGENFLPCLTQI